jgi:hypothetical protein
MNRTKCLVLILSPIDDNLILETQEVASSYFEILIHLTLVLELYSLGLMKNNTLLQYCEGVKCDVYYKVQEKSICSC